MELINKQAVLDVINSYGGADATEPEDKQCDDLVGAIYADVDSMVPEEGCTDDVAYIMDGDCGVCGKKVIDDWDYCPGCGRRLMA